MVLRNNDFVQIFTSKNFQKTSLYAIVNHIFFNCLFMQKTVLEDSVTNSVSIFLF